MKLPEDKSLTKTNPYQSVKPITPQEAALERVPRLREILTEAHQECNQPRDTTGPIMDILQAHVMQVFNQWTFDERGELEALARERMSAEDNQ